MIDAVHLAGYVDDPRRVAERLERRRTQRSDDPDDLPTVSGYVGPLRVTLRGDAVRIRGSLPKYMGQTEPLPFAHVAEARALLEETLGADLGRLAVWHLEITADLVLSRPVGVYLPLLTRSPRRQRIEYEGESVAFAVQTHRLTFYDLVARCRKTKEEPPPGNVLRVEFQIRKRLARLLGADGPLTFADLDAPGWGARLVARWRNEYEAVEKARAPLPFDALSDVRRGLQIAGLGVVGLETVEAAVRAQMGVGALTQSTGYARLQWARKLAADPLLTAEDARVAELDAAIRDAAQRALSYP